MVHQGQVKLGKIEGRGVFCYGFDVFVEPARDANIAELHAVLVFQCLACVICSKFKQVQQKAPSNSLVILPKLVEKDT